MDHDLDLYEIWGNNKLTNLDRNKNYATVGSDREQKVSKNARNHYLVQYGPTPRRMVEQTKPTIPPLDLKKLSQQVKISEKDTVRCQRDVAELEKLREDLLRQAEHIQTLEQQIKTLETEKQTLSAQDLTIGKLHSQKMELDQRVNELQTIQTDLQNRLDAAIRKGDGAERIAQLENMLKLCKDENIVLNSKLKEYSDLTALARSKVEKYKSEKEQDLGTIGKLRETNTIILRRVQTLTDDIERLKAAYGQQIAALQAQLEEANNLRNECSASLGRTLDDLQKNSKELRTLKEKYSQREEHLRKLEESNLRFQQLQDEHNRLKDSSQKSTEQNLTFLAENRKLKQTIERLNTRIQLISQELTESKARTTKYRSILNNIMNLVSNLDTAWKQSMDDSPTPTISRVVESQKTEILSEIVVALHGLIYDKTRDPINW